MMKNLGKLIAAVALCAATGIAAADGDSGDSSMNPYTGESWAALQGGGHNLGEYHPTVTVRVSKARVDKAPAAANAPGEATRLARGGRSTQVNVSRNDTAS